MLAYKSQFAICIHILLLIDYPSVPREEHCFIRFTREKNSRYRKLLTPLLRWMGSTNTCMLHAGIPQKAAGIP